MALLASDAGAREVLELLDQVLYGIVSLCLSGWLHGGSRRSD